MPSFIPWAVLIILVLLLIAKGLIIVRQSEVIIIERFGKYKTTLKSGINFIVPFIDSKRNIVWRVTRRGFDGTSYSRNIMRDRIDLREAVFDFDRQSVITKDNVGVDINAVIYYQVMDAYRVMYEIANLPDAIEKLTQTTLRNIIGELELDETLTSRDTINKKLGIILDEATDKWGVKINRVELQDINPPVDIREAMEKQMRAERDRRATILEAEGKKKAQILEAEGARESEINRAEGDKRSKVLRAEGIAEAKVAVANAEAEAIRRVANAVETENGDPINYLVAIRYVDTLKDMVSGKDNKTVYLPYEATSVLSSIGGIKDLLGKDGKS